ncbi:hypothetical protein WJX79_003095 [Trebouxia sp. C0005]
MSLTPEDPDGLYRMCRNSIDNDDPRCYNGGYLRAQNNTYQDNCAVCVCPDGWTGIDCSVCTTVDICPAKQLPDDSLGRFLTAASAAAVQDTKVDFHVVERGGTMSIDLNPHDFQYAYAGVWEGNFTGCTFSTGACTRPMQGDDCFVATCEGAGVVCPPPYVKKCPGWTPTSCGKIHEDQPGNYWMHRCNPLAIPKNDTATILSCKPQAVNGTFQCYFGQEGAFLASLGMQCQTGSCIYNSTHPEPPGPPAPPAPPPLPPHEHHDVAAEIITLISIGLVVSLGMILGGFLIYQDSRLSQERYKAWSEGEMNATTVTASLLGPDDISTDVVMDSMPETVALDWRNISCSIYKAGGQRLQVLTGVSGVTSTAHTSDSDTQGAKKGCLFAILGPSGAGKTTLLDILAGRRRGIGVTGQLTLNGHPVDGKVTRNTVGYAQQEPELPGTSTVWEYLRFHARLRMPDEQKRNNGAESRVWGVISQLGLNKVAHSLIGDAFTRGVSGGERRRVAIAAELLTSPACLLLDEPTTGLDSSNASRVVDILSGLASAGVTVIITIHQPRPDILRLMDRMLLLSDNGQVVYSGPLDSAAPYFKDVGFVADELRSNIADYMLDLVIRAADADVAVMVERFAGSDIAAKDDAAVQELCQSPWPLGPPRPHPPYLLQLRVLSTRLMRKLYRHPFLILVNFIATLVTAVALGLIFRNAGVDTGGIQNRLGCLFFMLLYLSMMSLSSLPIWRAEKLLFIRERDAGAYGTPAYYTAVLLFDIVPMRVVPPLFFAMFSYWMIGLHTQCTSCIFAFIGVLVSANIAATTMSQAIGAAVASVRVANLLGSLAIMMFLLFGGFLLNRDQVPWYCTWIADLSYFNYAYEALAVNEFHHAPVDFIFTSPLNDSVLPPLRVSGDGVLKEFGFVPGRGLMDAAMVWLLVACFGMLTYFFLETAGRTGQQSLWGISMAWVKSMKKSRRVSNGSEPESPLAGVNQELAEPSNGHISQTFSPYVGSSPPPTHPTLHKMPSHSKPSNGLITAAGADDDSRDVPVSVEGFLQVAPQIVSWQGISCTVPQGHSGQQRKILHSISGVAAVTGEDGQLMPCLFAVLGPSGAGKTTFMDILSGRKRDPGVSGGVSVNGQPLTAVTMQRLCGYVLQDDVLPGTSTVEEYLRFQADLRLPSSVHGTARQAHVQHLIHQLGLQKVATSLIGDEFTRGLSGGERRRVAIAAELLTSPACLLLDEPTTGLDSSNAARVVDILAGLASAGVTVIITIHQPRPDVFNLMQRVLILSGDGRLVYSGPKDMAAQHFATAGYFAPGRDISMADHMLDVVIRSEGAEVSELVDLYTDSQVAAADRALMHDLASSSDSVSNSGPLQLRYQASYWRQLAVLSRRLGKAMWVDPMLLAMNWGAALLMALGLGIVYWRATRDTGGIQNRFGSLFFILIYMSVMSLSSLPLWMEDRLLFIRERASGVYGTPAYFTATVLFDLIPMRVLPPCFFAAATYWMIGFRPGTWHLLTFLLLLVLSNTVGASMNMAIGAAAPSTAVANLLGSLAVLLSILFGGFLLSSKQMPNVVSWMAQLSFVRYGFEALVYNEYHGATGFFFTPYAQKRIPGAKLPSVEVDGDTILGTFGFETENIRNNVAVLVVLLCAYLTITLLLLIFKRH